MLGTRDEDGIGGCIHAHQRGLQDPFFLATSPTPPPSFFAEQAERSMHNWFIRDATPRRPAHVDGICLDLVPFWTFSRCCPMKQRRLACGELRLTVTRGLDLGDRAAEGDAMQKCSNVVCSYSHQFFRRRNLVYLVRVNIARHVQGLSIQRKCPIQFRCPM